MKVAAFTVDVDEIDQYFSIHGLEFPPGKVAHLAYDVALPRLLEFANRLDLPVTLFVVGHDLQRSSAANTLRSFVGRGDELGNHTLSHQYDISRLAAAERRAQIAEGAAAIVEATGFRVRGFRAPGYTLSQGMIDDLGSLGYEYDSSVFACPSYYAAKACVLGAQRVIGRRSASILDSPKVLLAPNEPYRVGTPYYRRGSGLREVPITLTKRLRLPFIGTTLGLLAGGALGVSKVRWFTRGVSELQTVNLELHAIDFLSVEDGLAPLAKLQPGLGVPWRQKAAAFEVVVTELGQAGFVWRTLRELAASAVA